MSSPRPIPTVAAVVALLAGIAGGAGVVGCEPAADVEPLACQKPRPGVGRVGWGNLATGYRELQDGADLQVVLGPQGLHMVVVSMRIEDFELPTTGGGRTVVSAATRVDGEVLGGTIAHVAPELAGGDADFVGIRSVFTAEVEVFVGKVADVVITAVDGCGRDVTSTRTVRLVQ